MVWSWACRTRQHAAARHPFPGPGLGVRVLGEVKKEYCDLLRRAGAIFIELRKADLYDKVSQAFTVFLPVRSVGVMGDGRKYTGLSLCVLSKPSTL